MLADRAWTADADDGEVRRVRPRLSDLHDEPREWHQRGLRHPDEIASLVHTRLLENVPADPAYRDFFSAE
ncbi:hypothetical protein C1N91_06830 [Curtobacterium sp. SGAir0471]|nr:hypothetical protein C1N91_06830 [Curtobacterium sp. SGAir0471]